MRNSLRLLFLAALLSVHGDGADAASVPVENSPQIVIENANWMATDDLGRKLPTYSDVGAPRSNRWVGLFYSPWFSPDAHWGPDYDVTEFLKAHPAAWPWEAITKGGVTNPTWYWGEPLFGYYQSTDPWVLRKHLCMIANAGVDFLYLDYTNLELYDSELKTMVATAEDLKSKGVHVPHLVFFLHTDPEWKVEALYANWYKPGLHDDMWFKWRGKPLIMCPMPTDASKLKHPELLHEIQNYFTWRPGGWPDENPKETATRWRYVDANPTQPAKDPDGRLEQTVASKSMGGPIWDNMKVGGVSCVPGFTPEYNDQYLSRENPRGAYFQYQFNRAEKVNAPILLVTGWNEWTASVWERPGVVFLGKSTKQGEGYIVDEFNMDFDRDLEPMKGGYNDNYYWQMVANLRRYKGMAAPDRPSANTTIPMNGNFGAWNYVRPVYRNNVGAMADRDWDGAPPHTHYTDHTSRNEIALAQVARDNQNLFFHVRTVNPLTPATDKNWMMLLIDIDASAATGWHGYDFLVNRSRTGNWCTVEKNAYGKWAWTNAGAALVRSSGKDLVIAIPRRLLGVNSFNKLKFDFKWVDNIPDDPGIMDFYTVGDVAPDTRFNYRFEEGSPDLLPSE